MASLITSTLLGSKLVLLGGITMSVGLFIFPFTFIANEIMTETHGKAASKKLIATGIWIQLYVLFFVSVGALLPSSPVRDLGDAYEKMFALAPRMVIASMIAYAVSQLTDITAFLKIKTMTQGRHLWLRANLATYISQAIDTTLFMVIFLGGVLPWGALLKTGITAYLVKIILGTVDTPFVYLGVKLVRWLDAKEKQQLLVTAVKTDIFKKGDDLVSFVVRHTPTNLIHEGIILAITSKIVSIAEDQVVSRNTIDKKTLVRREADVFLTETVHEVSLTIKHGILIPTAGIDESNSETNEFILFPKDPYQSAEKLWKGLKKAWGLKNLGVIITDSHTQALRKGVTGIGLSHYGFKATRDLVGQNDLFGRSMKMTHVNTLDALSVAAVYQMGEINECCPLAVIDAPHVEFTQSTSQNEIQIPLDEDLYGALFSKLGKEKS